MNPPPSVYLHDEESRLSALHRYQILDSEPEEACDDLTHLAALVCGTPMAMISFVDADRVWLKSVVGLPAGGLPRAHSFCDSAIRQRDVLIVVNEEADRQGSSGGRFRFYAGAPLLTPAGEALGMLAVMDTEVRVLDEAQKTALQALSRQVMALLELRLKTTQLQGAEAELVWKQAFLRAQANSSMDAILVVDAKGRKILQNQRTTEMLNIPAHIAEDKDDRKQVAWVTGQMKDPEEFVRRVSELYANPPEISRDIVELTDGKILDRYSAPVTGDHGEYFGRIWNFRDITESKKTEDSLRESEEKFHQLADHITDLFWISSPDLASILYVSAGYEVIMGHTVESLHTRPELWHEAIHEEDRDRVYGTFGRLMGTEAQVGMEYRIVRPDGEVRWVRGRGFQIRDAAGALVRLTGIVTDITESKKAEDALRASEERFRSYFELGLIGMAISSPSKRWVEVNNQTCAMLGYTRNELMNMTWEELTHPDDIEEDLANMKQVILGLIDGYTMNKRFICKDGRVIETTLSTRCVRRPDGGVDYFVVLLQDITNRKIREESLRLLGSAVEQSKESIVITEAGLDLPGPKIVFANPAFTAMTGHTLAEALGKTPRILQGPETDRKVLAKLRKNLEDGGTFEGETVNYRKDGTKFNMEWQIAPIKNAEGSTTHFVAIQRDITSRKKLESQLFESQKMETVGKLAGGVAHEFNSILTAIIGQSELLLKDVPAGSPLAHNATEISQAAERAAVLTRQLLAYGRKQFLQPVLLDLNEIMTGMERIFHDFLGPDVDTQFVAGHELKHVRADAGQIQQVLVNMVMNAADAMPVGGSLTLETANISIDPQMKGRHADLAPGDYVVLTVTDTGKGMTSEVRARVFEPFFSTKGVGEGTGLGLSTCYGIVKQSGGHISVSSKPGLGAVFKIYLPQALPEPKAPLMRLETPGMPRGSETILLVEDNPALREMAAILLTRLGYTVVKAANGIEALGLELRNTIGDIDLLFTDLVMPQMSGKELWECVCAIHPKMRVLFTSGHSGNNIVHQCALTDEVALLQKPFTPTALACKLREVLDAPLREGLPGRISPSLR